MLQSSELETALLVAFHRLYAARGFPDPSEVRIVRRENTGAGRFVYLDARPDVLLEDGVLDLGGQYIEMQGIPHGMMAVALIKNRRPEMIEIAVYGMHAWDGTERRWSIV